MNTDCLKEKSQALFEAKQEYEKLGRQLKELTREKIAEKFQVSAMVITGIAQLEIDDLILIGELIKERRKMLDRREHLRRKCHVAPFKGVTGN